MAFLTMTSPTSCFSLSVEEVKHITKLTQWMLNLFKFHLCLPNPKETTSFLNWWPAIKDAFFTKGLPFYVLQANDHV